MHNGAQAVAIAACNLVAEGWTRKAEARDNDNKPCDYKDPHASKFCVVRAIHRAAYDLDESDDAVLEVCNVLRRYTAGTVTWNDVHGRTQAEVIAVLRKVIADLEPVAVDVVEMVPA